MIIITGISGGIGNFIGERFASATDEAIVGTYYRHAPSPSEGHRKIRHVKADLTQEKEVAELVAGLGPQATNIKLVHCAGVTINAMLHKMEYAEWQRVIASNLDSAYLLTRKLLPIMRDQNFGRLLYVSSVVAQIGVAGTSPYAASKAALWGLMKSIVKENATKNITCNVLNLGYFNIGMIKEVPEAILQQITATIPVKKLGNPQEIFDTVNLVFGCEYMTGSAINLNGGLF